MVDKIIRPPDSDTSNPLDVACREHLAQPHSFLSQRYLGREIALKEATQLSVLPHQRSVSREAIRDIANFDHQSQTDGQIERGINGLRFIGAFDGEVSQPDSLLCFGAVEVFSENRTYVNDMLVGSHNDVVAGVVHEEVCLLRVVAEVGVQAKRGVGEGDLRDVEIPDS